MRWQPVPGKITWSVVDEQMIPQSRYGARLMYRPDIRYSYTIGTHEHEGTRVYIGSEMWHESDKEARGVVDAYPPAAASIVFYLFRSQLRPYV